MRDFIKNKAIRYKPNSICPFIYQKGGEYIKVSDLETYMSDKVVLPREVTADLDIAYTNALRETIGQHFPNDRYTALFHEKFIEAMLATQEGE